MWTLGVGDELTMMEMLMDCCGFVLFGGGC